jgi:hypothetical protein
VGVVELEVAGAVAELLLLFPLLESDPQPAASATSRQIPMDCVLVLTFMFDAPAHPRATGRPHLEILLIRGTTRAYVPTAGALSNAVRFSRKPFTG